MIAARRIAGIFVTLAFVLAACSGSSSGGAADPDAACSDFAHALCAKLNDCFPFAIKLQYGDVDTCATREKTGCVNGLRAPSTGSTTTQLSDCQKAISATACGDVLVTPPDACKTAAGSLANGAACGDDAQCQGRNCRTTGTNACGACSTRGAAGATCETAGDCEEGLSCAAGKCVAPAKAGQACSPSQPCQALLVCSGGTCAQALAAGAPCDPKASACDSSSGLYCDPQAKVCKQVDLAGPGQTCGSVNGALVLCSAGGTCKRAPSSATGTCEAAAGDGQPCDDENGPKCTAPSRCVNGVCTTTDPASCK